MAPRPPLALAVGVALCLMVIGCDEADPSSATVTPTRYIDAVQMLLAPPAQLASSISERTGGGDAPAPTRQSMRALVDEAREGLARFRALDLDDPVLLAQRDRLASAYARMLPRMSAAADALAPPAGGGRAAAAGPASAAARGSLAAAADPFLDALRALPSAASPPSR